MLERVWREGNPPALLEEYKLIEPLWRTLQDSLKQLGIKPPCDPAIPLLGLYPEQSSTEKDACNPVFITALFTITRTWKQPKCPSTDEWIKHLWYSGISLSHTKECIWVSPSEVDVPRDYYTEWGKSEREKQLLYTNTYIWNLERWHCWTYLQSSNGADIENRLMDTACREWGGRYVESNGDTFISICKIDSQWGLAVCPGN